MTNTTDLAIPLIIRGQVIEDYGSDFAARFGSGTRYATPDLGKYLGDLPLRDPRDMADVQALPLDEIVDYLDALSARLHMPENRHLQHAFELALHSSPLTGPVLRHSYEHLATLFSREVVREMLETSIGIDHLEGWVEARLANGTRMSVRAFGARAVHVISGTGPVVTAMTILRNAVTRGDAIIKLPSNDPATAVAIIRTMIDLDPTHPLTKHVSAAYWRGGDTEIESRIYDPRHIEKIVAWGGAASMTHITQYLQPGIDLIAFDPKWSATIIGAAAFADDHAMEDAAQRLAADVGAYNQIGCANARVVFIETGCEGSGLDVANRFGALVQEKLQGLPNSLSTSPKQFDRALKAEIDGLAMDRASYRTFGSPDDGMVIVSQFDEAVDFTSLLADRVANLVPVASIEDALEHITYYTQTVGVYPDDLKHRLRDVAPLYGAQRLVSLGYACAPPLAGPWDAMEPLRRMCRWVMDQTSEPDVTPPQWQAGVHGGYGA